MKTQLFGLLLVMVLAGCSSVTPYSPREAFLARTPERAAYAKLYEVSPESLRENEEGRLRLTKAFVQGVRNAKKRGADLEEHLAAVERLAGKLHEERLDWIRELESGYDPKTDVILFFHYWPEDEKQDVGYFVTRNGRVIKTVPKQW